MADDVKFFYANSLEIAMSVYDFSFTFIRQGSLPENKPMAPGETAARTAIALDSIIVSMSPSHAKATLKALTQHIATYEKMFGVIPMQPETAK